MKRYFRAKVGVLLAGCASTLYGCNGGTSTPIPVATQQIVFRSNRDGNFEIYSQSVDASGVPQGAASRLTNNTANESDPALRPGRQEVAFVSMRDESHGEIYVLNLGTSSLRRLTNNTVLDSEPVWSPDGTRLAFTTVVNSRFEVAVINAGGGQPTILETGHSASWSPDGTRLAFVDSAADNPSNSEIFVMNANGSGRVNLTNNGLADDNPAWSPDGTQIIFDSNRDAPPRAGFHSLYVMSATGSPAQRLTNTSGGSTHAAWSPDGNRLAFARNDAGQRIAIINANGSGESNLTDVSSVADQPDWR